MKNSSRLFLHQFLKVSTALCFSVPLAATAQIVPDNSLPNNSVIDRNGNFIEINGGTASGKNLFHSFEQFSVPGGNTAYFNNATDIQNIFTRVTGGNVSVVEGILKANGTANLFLLNPNGIIFGQNAQLDLGGSFLATTADRIVFADGTSFSATKLNNTPILTVSVPVGLGFGRAPEAIQVRGTGHKLQGLTSLFSPVIRDDNPTGLSISSGKTISLIGGDVTFDGGILTAEGGRIEVGSVKSGSVGLNLDERGLSLNYEGVSNFKNVRLSQQALLDASGKRSGSIQIQGNNISFNDGSFVLLQNEGNNPSGSITINAIGSLSLSGLTSDGRIASNVRSEAKKNGQGADINISTGRLQLSDGSRIGTRTYGKAEGGDVFVIASDFISLRGSTPSGTVNSAINANTTNDGNAGNIFVSTPQLTIVDGGLISSLSAGGGTAGNVTVNATDINLFGTSPILAPSSISVTAFTRGNAGNLVINSSNLSIKDGAEVTSSGIGLASAGNVSINARRVDISNESGISSAVVDAGELEQEIFGSFPITSGNSGTITINSEQLNVSETSRVSTTNEGTGRGGAIAINANAIQLNNDGGIVASTDSGEGGNIFINSNDLRLNDSEVTATAGGTGNGGDVRINTGTLVALDESQITARAVEGRGGNIFINARGVFIDRPVEEVFNADSELGIDGTVTINTPDLNISKEFDQSLPQTISTEEVIARSCVTDTVATRRNSLVNVGNTGLPPNPETIIDEFNLQATNKGKESQSLTESDTPSGESATATPTTYISSVAPWQPRTGTPIVRGTELVRTNDGRLLFVAEASSERVEGVEYLTCH